jgi:hypothetical protein
MSTSAAWATVAAAIGGATVSGIVAVFLAFVQRRSLNDQASWQRQSQREQFEARAAEEHRQWQLESQRDAYVSCLISMEKLRDMLAPLAERLGGSWPRRDGVPAAETRELDSLVSRFRERYDEAFARSQMARLAGPPDMAGTAQHALNAMAAVRDALDERVRCARANAKAPDGGTWASAATGLHEAVESFIAQAAAILGAAPHRQDRAQADTSAGSAAAGSADDE